MPSYVTTAGPIFDGRAELAAQQGTNAIAEAVAAEGLNLVKDDLGVVIRTHPSGRYIPSVRRVRTGASDYEVGTRIVYGRWIEGTSSRNLSTRFKGYATFRRMTQQLDRRSKVIGERTIQPYIARMN